MRHWIGVLGIALALPGVVPGVSAQDSRDDLDPYFRAVSRYFDVDLEEVRILTEWSIPPSEIPVVLFLAGQAGISPDAAASERSRGSSWQGLMRQYGIQVSALYMPLEEGVPLGGLEEIHTRFARTPRASWDRFELSDDEVTGLINLRVLVTALRVDAGRIMRARGSGIDWSAVPRSLAGAG